MTLMAATMEPVVGLANKYRGEFEDTYEGLKQRTLKLQEAAPQMMQEAQQAIEPQKQELVNTLQDQADVATPPTVILGTLGWASVLVFSMNFTSYFASYIFAPIIGLFMGGIGATVAAVGAVPYFAYYTVQNDIAVQGSDVSIRFRLLSVALTEGVLMGFILSNSYLYSQPLACLTPLIAAVAYPFAAEKFGANRQMLLGGSVGAAFGVNIVLGLLSGYLSFTYLLMAVFQAAATAATLQFIYKNVQNDQIPTYNYQLLLVIQFVVIRLLMHAMFGMTSEQYSETVAASARH